MARFVLFCTAPEANVLLRYAWMTLHQLSAMVAGGRYEPYNFGSSCIASIVRIGPRSSVTDGLDRDIGEDM